MTPNVFKKPLGGLAHLFTLTPWLRRPAAKQARKLREWQRLATIATNSPWLEHCAEGIGHHAGRLFALREAAYNGKTPFRDPRASEGYQRWHPLSKYHPTEPQWLPSLSDATEPRPVSLATIGRGRWLLDCQRWACSPYHNLTHIGPGAVSVWSRRETVGISEVAQMFLDKVTL